MHWLFAASKGAAFSAVLSERLQFLVAGRLMRMQMCSERQLNATRAAMRLLYALCSLLQPLQRLAKIGKPATVHPSQDATGGEG